ncbi:hypothetical protein GS634_22040 [Ruegeria atlantica]|uniref:Uncharacterized protein n=1 Tax=Ruegeria atlantica TaxID=81569 RepID=A0AA90Z2J3_9RHOB|nr:hypothetical protein [Ruegeria atlantica]NOE20820.1 hypothetical protein [Ruegeria atlantica]
MKQTPKEHSVWLMIAGGELFPFSTHGFNIAQGSLRSVAGRAHGSLFLNPFGEVLSVVEVSPIKQGVVARAKRVLGFGYGIRVKLKSHQISLTDLKKKIRTGYENYPLDPDESWEFMRLEKSEAEAVILAAKTTKELYSALDLPASQYCLDLF